MNKLIAQTTDKSSIINLISLCILIALFMIVLVVNHYAPLYSDDYLYSFRFNPGFTSQNPSHLTYEKINSVSDYFQSLKDLYQNLTGRIVAHGMLQFILLFPQWVFDIINTIMLFLYVFLLSKWVLWKDNKLIMQYMLIAFSLYYISIFGTETNLYLSAFSCNYIWTQVIVLVFLLTIRAYINDKDFYSHSFSLAIIMLLAGIIAGDTNEPVVPGIIIAIFVLGTYKLITFRRIPIWLVVSLCGLLIGFAFLYFAPGNDQRVMYEAEKNSSNPTLGINFGNLTSIIYLSLKAIPTFIVAMISLLFFDKRNLKLDKWIPLFFILLIILGIMVAFLFTPILPKRLSIVLAGFYTLIALYLLYLSRLNKSIILLLIFFCLSPLLVDKVWQDISFLSKSAKEYKLVEEQIKESKSDSLLVNPRGYLDPLTRSNWAKPIATYYDLKYLWVYNVLDSTFFNNSRQVRFRNQETIDRLNNTQLKSDVVILSHYDLNDYSRFYYVEIPIDTNIYKPEDLNLSMFYSKNSNLFEALNIKLPRFLLNYSLSEPHGSRRFSYRVTDDGILFAFATANEGLYYDRIRFTLTYQNKAQKDIYFHKVNFND